MAHQRCVALYSCNEPLCGAIHCSLEGPAWLALPHFTTSIVVPFAVHSVYERTKHHRSRPDHLLADCADTEPINGPLSSLQPGPYCCFIQAHLFAHCSLVVGRPFDAKCDNTCRTMPTDTVTGARSRAALAAVPSLASFTERFTFDLPNCCTRRAIDSVSSRVARFNLACISRDQSDHQAAWRSPLAVPGIAGLCLCGPLMYA